MGDLYQRTMKKAKYLQERGYEIVSMWECEYHELTKDRDRLERSLVELEL